MPPSIEILIDEKDLYPDGYHYLIWGLKAGWEELGLTVRVARGLRALKGADLVIPHLDLTVTPGPVRQALDRLPNVVNRGLYDISKRRVSSNLLGPDDEYEGPVIVKTDENHGGTPERLFQYRNRTFLEKVRRKVGRQLDRRRRSAREGVDIRGCQYPIFERLSEVPPEVFRDPGLVVERFLPEDEGNLFYVRWYMFFGDRYRCSRVGAPDPIVKAEGKTAREDGQPVPEEVVAKRNELAMDLGKIDFVIHDGRTVILDVNRTPGGPPPERALERCGAMARGVFPLLDRPPGSYVALSHRDVENEDGEGRSV